MSDRTIINLIESDDIGEDTKIWNFTHVREGASIGRECTIGDNCYIDKGVDIGNYVKIQNGCNIFDGVQIEDDVFIAPSVTFTNVKRPRSEHPVDDSAYYQTVVKKGATIGANSTIICGAHIGNYAFVGAGSVVTRHVAPHNIVWGNPARLQGVVCECGDQILGLCYKEVTITCGCGLKYEIKMVNVQNNEMKVVKV